MLMKIKKNGANGSHENKTLSKMMSSNEIVTLINALGTGSTNFNMEDLDTKNSYDRCRC